MAGPSGYCQHPKRSPSSRDTVEASPPSVSLDGHVPAGASRQQVGDAKAAALAYLSAEALGVAESLCAQADCPHTAVAVAAFVRGFDAALTSMDRSLAESSPGPGSNDVVLEQCRSVRPR